MLPKGVGLRVSLYVYGERADITLGLVYEIFVTGVDCSILL